MNIKDFKADFISGQTFITNLFERKKAQVIKQVTTCLLSDGIHYTGADNDWNAVFDTVRDYAGIDLDRWARYNPILQKYSNIPATVLIAELKNLAAKFRPLVNDYKDNLLISSEFERKRKQFLNGLEAPNYIKLTFRKGEITEIAVRRGSAVFKMPNIFLHLINTTVNGKVEISLGKSCFDCFADTDAEIAISKGKLFTSIVRELKDLAEMGTGIKGAVSGIERNSYNAMLIRQLQPLYIWYKENDIQERTLYTYTEFLNGLFRLNFSEQYIKSTQGRK